MSAASGAVERLWEHGEDGPIRWRKFWPLELTVEHEDLTANSEDLGVSFVSRDQEQSDSGENKPE